MKINFDCCSFVVYDYMYGGFVLQVCGVEQKRLDNGDIFYWMGCILLIVMLLYLFSNLIYYLLGGGGGVFKFLSYYFKFYSFFF